MADKHLTENLKGNYFSSERKDMTFLKGITLVALLPIWAGYAFALYNGDSNNLSNYSLLILAFSAMNFNAICGVEKIENKVLNLVAKLDGVLFFVWGEAAVFPCRRQWRRTPPTRLICRTAAENTTSRSLLPDRGLSPLRLCRTCYPADAALSEGQVVYISRGRCRV